MVFRQKFGKRVWLVMFLVAGAIVPSSLRADGGRSNLDETVLFRWLVTEDRFAQLSPSEIQPKNLYVRWDNGEQHYVWVTGDNRHMILSKTRVQGGRLGYTGQNAKNWFTYNELDLPSWKKTTERSRPQMWRWDPARVVGGSFTTGTYVSERAATGWENWGGELDLIAPPVVDPPVTPPAANELGCTIEGAATATVGSSVILTMKTTGPVKSAMLNGAAVDFPVVLRAWTAERAAGTLTPDVVTIVGSVRGDRGTSAECKLVIKITK